MTVSWQSRLWKWRARSSGLRLWFATSVCINSHRFILNVRVCLRISCNNPHPIVRSDCAFANRMGPMPSPSPRTHCWVRVRTPARSSPQRQCAATSATAWPPKMCAFVVGFVRVDLGVRSHRGAPRLDTETNAIIMLRTLRNATLVRAAEFALILIPARAVPRPRQ